MHNDIHNGDRVLVYDNRAFINDVKTPCRTLMRPATVIIRYGTTSDYGSGPCKYPDLVDVVFDHRPFETSRGHFTELVERIQ